MKTRLRFVVFSTSLSLIASVASAHSEALHRTIPEHAGTIPVPREGRWMDRHHELSRRAKEMPDAELVFIGDSITQGWEGRGQATWDKYYSGRKTINLGISGDRTQHVLWRLHHGNFAGLHPKLAVVMIGTNNVGQAEPDSAAQAIDGVAAILQTIHKMSPKTKILLLAVFPRGATPDDPKRRLTEEVNQAIEKFGDDETVFYLDINKKFLDENGALPKEIMPDLLHPNEKGYQIWAAEIESKVAELLE